MSSIAIPPCFTLTDGTALTFAGQGDRYRKNIQAITLLRRLQAEGRAPADLTDEERLSLAHYTAFGESALLHRALGENATDLADLLSREEQRALTHTSLTAFYTSSEVLKATWAALARMLEPLTSTIKVLEPAFGIGNYIATMPIELRARAQITAVELDNVSSQIAAYLHPDVHLYGGQAFEETDLPADEYDLVVSNVPFGQDRVFDPQMKEAYLRRTIHDYFIARALRLVRPGGIVAVITSYGTMDKRDTRVRAWIAEQARLICAVRLPQGAFRVNAGTACGSDLLIFRRALEGEDSIATPAWTETAMRSVPLVDNDGSDHCTFASLLNKGAYTEQADNTALLRMNRYFVLHPAQIAGNTRVVRNGEHRFSYVAPLSDTTLGAALAERLENLPPIHPRPAQATAVVASTQKPRLDTRDPRVAGLLAIYNAAKRVIRLDVHAQDATQARADLNAVYDTFLASYGPIHTRANQQALKGEPELLFLLSLESAVTQGCGTVTARKATIFTHPTIRPTPRVVEGSLTPDDALVHCLDELGRVDMPRIAQYCGEVEGDAAAALKGRIYREPTTGGYVTADEYLSGNIRVKLAAAQRATATDPSFQHNIEALQEVLPTPLTPGQIKVKFGAPWVPPDVVLDFIVSIIPRFSGSPYARGTIQYHRPLAKWTIADAAYSRNTHAATIDWGTGRMHAIELLEKALNNQTPAVYDELDGGGRVINQKETLLAREKQACIKEQWARWVWQDPDRTERLCRIYNELFNSSRRRDFDGTHLTLPGINTSILRGGDLAKHQKDAVWMGLQTPSVLLDLCVGAGKTFIGIVWAHELKRLGLAKKVLITVPNHLVEQWAVEVNRLYPDMRVLAMAADDFTKERRGTFLSRIATEEWDAIICAHTSFGFIEVGAIAREFMRREIDDLRTYLENLKHTHESTRGNRQSMKAIERKVAALETKLKDKEQTIKHDDARIINWEELRIDALFVDEAHEFKNLAVPTLMGNLPGVPKGDSQRAFDMRIKTWDIQRRGGRVVFATGTPVLNTLGEVFIMQKYLQEDVLAAHGIEHFDAWASTFAETQTVFEMTPDGGGFRMQTRLCKFVNLPELFHLWFHMTFSRSRAQLGLPTPKLIDGKPIPISVPGSPTLKHLVRSFVRRVEAIKSGAVAPTEDNMLKVTSDGRKAALDVRLVVGGPEEPACKINMLVQTIAELYHKYDAAKATQLVYCELSTPKAQKNDKKEGTDNEDISDETAPEGVDKGFVYHEIREKLVARGLPREQIAFIQEHNTKTKRAALFAAMNRGDVRVLIASKQSTGMNIQRRLGALHNLDAPWRPGDLEQRIGRIERQGNLFPEIYVCNYVTEGSFDGFIWQTLETKARFLGQMRAGDVTIREIDDLSEVVLSAAEIKAIASGNPKVIRKVQLDAEVIKLASLEASYRDTQARRRRKLRDIAWGRLRLAERRALLLAAQAVVMQHQDQEFKAALVNGARTNEAVAYTKRDAAGKALNAIALDVAAQAHATKERITRTVGVYRGLLIRAQAHQLMGIADIFLAVERDGVVQPITGNPVKLGNDQGVFASIDHQMRDFADAIQRLDRERAAQDQEEAQINIALDQPWDQAERYAALQAELETLNAELSRQSDETGTPEVVEVADASAPDLAMPGQSGEHLPLLPPVALPEPSDVAAMEAAVAHMAALETMQEEGDAAEAEVAIEAAEVEDLAEVEVAVAEDGQRIGLTPSLLAVVPAVALEHQDVIRHSRKAAVAFGNLDHIRQMKAPQKQAKRSTATTADRFADAPATAIQMSLCATYQAPESS